MEKEELLQKYREIEKKIVPIKDFLEEKKDSTEYKGLYRGIITLQSPLIFNPEILFIGINSGDGAYKEKNWNNPTKNETPLKMIGEDVKCFKELNWFQKENARGYFKNKKEKKDWVGFEWYQRNQNVNNRFPKNMIDLLYEIAKIKYNCDKTDNTTEPFWHEDFGKRIMCTNLYPIVTTDTRGLKKVHGSLATESSLLEFWQGGKSINEWEVRKYFIKRTYELIELTQPKLVVCMGLAAFNDFLYTNCKEDISTKFTTIGEKQIPIVGFSRKGNWGGSSNIKKIAEEIGKHLQ